VLAAVDLEDGQRALPVDLLARRVSHEALACVIPGQIDAKNKRQSLFFAPHPPRPSFFQLFYFLYTTLFTRDDGHILACGNGL
jgi:hypothetical protein